MKTVIWKYFVPVQDSFALDLPSGAMPLTVQAQRDRVCLWIQVQPENPREQRIFHVRGTGHVIDSDEVGEYIGSFQILNGDFVGHLFEGKT